MFIIEYNFCVTSYTGSCIVLDKSINCFQTQNGLRPLITLASLLVFKTIEARKIKIMNNRAQLETIQCVQLLHKYHYCCPLALTLSMTISL